MEVTSNINKETQRELFLHLGFPKTGTTTLQRHVFSRFNEFRNLGKINDNYGELRDLKFFSEFISAIYFTPDEKMMYEYKKFNDSLKDLEYSRYKCIDNSIPIIISNEQFTTYLFNPFYFGYGGYRSPNIDLLFSRIRKFSDMYNYKVKIILVLRDAKSLIHSLYAQTLYRSYFFDKNTSLRKYLTNINDFLSSDNFNVSNMFEHNLDNRIVKYFSKNEYNILKFEEIFNSNDNLIHSLNRVFNKRKLNIVCDVDFVENKRHIGYNKKVGSIKPGWMKSYGFFKSLNMAFQCFYYYYKTPKQLEKKIVWDDECDKLFHKIEKYYQS